MSKNNSGLATIRGKRMSRQRHNQTVDVVKSPGNIDRRGKPSPSAASLIKEPLTSRKKGGGSKKIDGSLEQLHPKHTKNKSSLKSR